MMKTWFMEKTNIITLSDMKTRISLVIAACLTLCAMSCSEDAIQPQTPEVDGNYITCEVNDEASKTHLDGDFYVVWDENDEILVKGANGTAIYKLESGAGERRGVFKKISGVDLTGSSFVAYSPASAYDGTKEVWPETQQYVSAGVVSGAPMKAEASSLGEVFHFKNMGGLLRLTLKVAEGTKNVSYIKLKTEDKNFVLNCPSGGIEVGTAGTPFYIELPAKDAYTKFVIEATATDGAACQKIAKTSIAIERSKITSLTATTKDWLYLVSVSPTDKVIFAPGNLYCVKSGSSYSFHFEASQTDYRQRNDFSGDSAVIGGVKGYTPANTSGLFQWAGNGSTAVQDNTTKFTHGAFTVLNTDIGELAGNDSDSINFGDNYGDGKTWRSLTKDEWDYMVNVRKVQGATGYGNTCVWWTFGYTQGLLIFPDGYTGPKEGFTVIPEHAIFLPDAGYGLPDKTIPYGKKGCYWTSTASSYSYYPGGTAYGIHMPEVSVGQSLVINAIYRDHCYSMRLVSDKWDAE